MKAWVKFWALRLGLGSACLVVVANLAMETTLALTIGRAIVAGFVIYTGTLFLGGMVGNSLMTLVAEQAALREEKKRREAEKREAEPEDEIDEAVQRLAADANRQKRSA